MDMIYFMTRTLCGKAYYLSNADLIYLDEEFVTWT